MDTQKWLELCFLSSRSKKSLFAWIFKSLQRACHGCRINDAKGSQNKSLLRIFGIASARHRSAPQGSSQVICLYTVRFPERHPRSHPHCCTSIFFTLAQYCGLTSFWTSSFANHLKSSTPNSFAVMSAWPAIIRPFMKKVFSPARVISCEGGGAGGVEAGDAGVFPALRNW